MKLIFKYLYNTNEEKNFFQHNFIDLIDFLEAIGIYVFIYPLRCLDDFDKISRSETGWLDCDFSVISGRHFIENA